MEKIPSVNRRNFIALGSLATGMTALQMTGALSTVPDRAFADTTTAAVQPSDIQFDIGAFIAPAQTSSGVTFQLPPVHSVFLTAQLLRRPFPADQAELARVLGALEVAYQWGASGLVTFVSYGVPYFNRLNPVVVGAQIPRLASNTSRSVLQEAVAAPTDVVSGNGITKLRYNVPVRIENNDLVFTLRSDNATFLQDAVNFLNGSNSLRGVPVRSPAFGGLLKFTSSRAMFVQQGLPRSTAQQNNLPFANFIQTDSPMWMGFLDQQTNAAGPAAITTFAGNSSSHLTTSSSGQYFDNGSIQHLSHNIIDMLQWFDMDTATSAPDDDGVFTERVQYMFHSPQINNGNTDQFTNGGGPSILPNQNNGTGYAAKTAQGIGTNVDPTTGQTEHRMGHLSTLQRSSRASDGTPAHIRMDGPGFDNLDVPDGSKQPKLQFTIFVPTSDFFQTMRKNQSSLDLKSQFTVPDEDNGLERFITATRRQNFLIPPRRHRAFPLVDIGG
ncbi:MAG TPA: hypothetical protein VHW44_28620 [Pseudonocardiaceae bacterium]|nr:hypothetical protein [Pseudonocardiaceae bacterium]